MAGLSRDRCARTSVGREITSVYESLRVLGGLSEAGFAGWRASCAVEFSPAGPKCRQPHIIAHPCKTALRLPSSFAHNAVVVAVVHILVGGMTTRHRRDAVRAGLSAGDTAVSVAVVQLKCMAAAKCSLRACTMHFQSPGLCRRPDNGQRASGPLKWVDFCPFPPDPPGNRLFSGPFRPISPLVGRRPYVFHAQIGSQGVFWPAWAAPTPP